MAWTSLVANLRSRSVGYQLLLLSAGVMVLGALLILLWALFLRVTYEPLFTGLRAVDASTIVAALDERKLAYRLSDHGTTILVPTGTVDATRLVVTNEDLPLKGTVGFELFNKSDMGLTDFAQKINYQRALQGELARTIMTLDGVDAARVHLALCEDRLFRDDRIPPKASVTIRMKDGLPLASEAAQGVQRLVAAAVPQLEATNVVILDEAGDVISAPPGATSDALAAPFMQQKQAVEVYYKAQIRSVFNAAYPGKPIAVAVSVGLPSAAGSLDAEPLSNWSPAARNFALRVTLEPSWRVDVDSQADIRNLVATAVGIDTERGDGIEFGRVPAVAVAEPAATNGASSARGLRNNALVIPAESSIGGSAPLWIAALFVLGGAAFAGGILFRSRLAGQLTPSEQLEFAERLRVALDREENHVPSA